jgi:hypothetical protein
MAENIDNLVLENLRHIRAKVDKNEHEMDELKSRVTRIELSLVSMRHEFADMFEYQIRQQNTNDRIIERIERIERRLDLQD